VGRARIKGLSISKAVLNALAKPFRSNRDTQQKGTETSLIERFLYPKYGPGQMWEEAACRVSAAGGRVHLRHEVIGLHRRDDRIEAVDVRDLETGEVRASSATTWSLQPL